MKVTLIGGPFHGEITHSSQQVIVRMNTDGVHRYFRPNRLRWKKVPKKKKWLLVRDNNKLFDKAVYMPDDD